MLIECIIKRKGGTRVTLDDHEYHFEPLGTDPRHLEEVLIQAHAERFLAISDGYRYAGEGAPPGAKPEEKAPVDSRMPRTSLTHAASYQIGDKSVTLAELTIRAQIESGLTVDEWNEQDDQDLYEHLDTTLEELREADKEGAAPPPPRGKVIQPEPEKAHEDAEEDEADRLALEAAMRQANGGTQDGADNADQGGAGAAQQQGDNGPGAGGEATNTTATNAATGTANGATGDNSNASEAKVDNRTREELDEAYKLKMGRKPSKQLSDDRVRQLLAAEDEDA